MSNCTYCGKPAGLFRRFHPECKAQHERAVATIPAFFEKLLHSTLPVERFQELLREVAGTFHIPAGQMRSLSISGIEAMLDSAASERLPTAEDQARILAIATALGLSVDDTPALAEKFAKVDILRELDLGQIPDRVTVVGPMPFEFEPNETTIWIFNGTKISRPPKSEELPAPPRAASGWTIPDYCSPSGLEQVDVTDSEAAEVGSGDLMLTNRHLFLIFDDRHRKIPFSKIRGVKGFSNGFRILRSMATERTLSFLVNDPWFAVNLVSRLIRLSHGGVSATSTEDADAALEETRDRL